ncbi:major facilitator superfamily domain-containing protein [Alternaria rosae]|uniref:major facilitator superfamily domain-containing protein n=1 Tax=Alternaria rosae TaxID=1187941 RepID=UPI001E8DF975|nr:major facilitator superfamily domain-containing protein [Alternaria rosae]KAH6851573.1 major facilitator superfamily domain-containing protein [Alternaria rosae]
MAGAAIEVMNDLGKPTTAGPSSGVTRRTDGDLNVGLDHNAWLLGVTVGVPFFAGAVLGLIITDPITRILRFGRRGAICAAGIFSFISVVGSASVHKWEHLLGFRILLGAGMAGKASIVPILLSETSPKDVRGFLLVFWQLFVAFGLAAGSVANMAVYRLDVHSSWRYMFISAFIPALILLSLILFSPESPRWLLKESGALGKHSEVDEPSENHPQRGELIRAAYNSLVDLRGEAVPILAAGELFMMHTRLIDEQRRLKAALDRRSYTSSAAGRTTNARNPFFEVIQHISWRERVTLIFFRSGYTKRAHRAAIAVMVSQQLCGINLIAFMADYFFRYSFFHGDRHTNPDQNMQLLGASLGLMLLNFIATIPALFYIDDSDGRRRLLNCSFPAMASSLLVSALVLKIPNRVVAIALHYVFLVIFMIAYSIGEGPAAFVISAEVFPLVNRELGMSLAVCWNFMGAGILAVFAPSLLKALDQFGVLLLFAGTNLVAWFLCYWLVPSTGQENLEEVFEQLDITTWFMFKYTLKAISHVLTAPVDRCLRRPSKLLKECGYPKKLGPPRQEWEEWKRRAQQSGAILADPADVSSESSADETDVPSDTEPGTGIELLHMATRPSR